jgi:probable rRNA maturation factor
MNRIEINAEGVEPPPWREESALFAGKALEKLGHDNWDLSLLFCNNAYIRSLNAQYRNIDEPTDVLSFSSGTEPGRGKDGRFLPGDIVISLDALEENAEFFKVSVDEELRRLLIHGILHLSGMNHVSNDPDEPMLLKQEKILSELSGTILTEIKEKG